MQMLLCIDSGEDELHFLFDYECYHNLDQYKVIGKQKHLGVQKSGVAKKNSRD